MSEDWREDALCSQVGGDLWFPEEGGDGGTAAKRACALCPVQAECLEYAVTTFQTWGVWAGKTRAQLAKIRLERGLVNPELPVGFRNRRSAA